MTHAMEFYQSEAFRSLSNAERKILTRIEIEHMKHGGKDNGRLTCTYEDFIAYGVRRPSIPAALRHLQTVGILHVTQRGRRDAVRNPHHYRLTYLPSSNGKWPTNAIITRLARHSRQKRPQPLSAKASEHVKSPVTKT